MLLATNLSQPFNSIFSITLYSQTYEVLVCKSLTTKDLGFTNIHLPR